MKGLYDHGALKFRNSHRGQTETAKPQSPQRLLEKRYQSCLQVCKTKSYVLSRKDGHDFEGLTRVTVEDVLITRILL